MKPLFKRKRFFALVFIIILICVNIVLAEDRLKFIGEDKVFPYSYKTNGQIKGTDPDILAEVARRMNISINIELVPFKRMKVYVKKGLCDAGFTMFYMKEREKFGIYPRLPFRYSNYSVFVKQGREFKFKSIEDLYGKNVGSVIGYHISEEFDTAVADGRIMLHEVPNHIQNIKKLLSGRIDCLINNYDYMLITMKDMGVAGKIVALPTSITELKGSYIVFSKAGRNIGNKEAFVKNFSSVLEEMKKDGTFQRIYKKYFN